MLPCFLKILKRKTKCWHFFINQVPCWQKVIDWLEQLDSVTHRNWGEVDICLIHETTWHLNTERKIGFRGNWQKVIGWLKQSDSVAHLNRGEVETRSPRNKNPIQFQTIFYNWKMFYNWNIFYDRNIFYNWNMFSLTRVSIQVQLIFLQGPSFKCRHLNFQPFQLLQLFHDRKAFNPIV